MLTKTNSAAIIAIDAIPVTIETMSTKGVGFTIVGLPDAAVKDGYQRIITALEQSNVGWKHRRIVINLAPADIKKEGAGFDLPMAIGMMAANELKGQVSERDGLVYFTYEKKVAAKRFSYYAFAFEGSEDFWLIQFAIPAKKQAKLEEELWAFAATVMVP